MFLVETITSRYRTSAIKPTPSPSFPRVVRGNVRSARSVRFDGRNSARVAAPRASRSSGLRRGREAACARVMVLATVRMRASRFLRRIENAKRARTRARGHALISSVYMIRSRIRKKIIIIFFFYVLCHFEIDSWEVDRDTIGKLTFLSRASRLYIYIYSR